MPRHREEWIQRYARGGPLGFGSELWRSIPRDHPGYDAIADELRGVGREPTEERVPLQNGPLADRHLANYAAHASAIPRPWTAADLTDDKEVVVPIPDRVETPIQIAEQLKFTTGRELRGFAQTVLTGVVEFMDELLEAFEDARRDRRITE